MSINDCSTRYHKHEHITLPYPATILPKLFLHPCWVWEASRVPGKISENTHTQTHKQTRTGKKDKCSLTPKGEVMFDLRSGKHAPHWKPNDQPLYIHKSSNHQPSILRNLPAAIDKRVSSISCVKDIFSDTALMYEKALAESGFPGQLKHVDLEEQHKSMGRRVRQRRVTWLNPLYSKSMSTNVGKRFLTLVWKHLRLQGCQDYRASSKSALGSIGSENLGTTAKSVVYGCSKKFTS